MSICKALKERLIYWITPHICKWKSVTVTEHFEKSKSSRPYKITETFICESCLKTKIIKIE